MGTASITMKVAALLLLSFLALANASLNTCRCGMFITVGTVEYEVHELPPVENVDCDDKSICKKTCRAEFEKLTGGGDMNFELPSGYSVGQELCIAMSNHQIHNCRDETVYGYYDLCDTLWQFDGETSSNELCCREGHYHDCATLPRAPAFQVNQHPISYSRCDSGFNSGLDSSQLQKLDFEPSQTSGKTPSYNRVDSGIYSQFSSMTINESSNGARAENPLTEASHKSGESQDSSKPDTTDYIELYEPDQDGDSQLHLAIASGYQEVVFAMVRLAPHPDYLNLQNNELYAPLHIAVLTNQPVLVRRLVVAGAKTSIRDQEGNTPLHLASKRGHLQCAEAILRPISAEESQASPGSVNWEQENLQGILNQKNFNGEHCLHLATYGEHFDFIRFLCWSGADMNATEGRSGKTALHYAVNKRQEPLVQLLATPRLAGGCEVEMNIRDWAGRTPLQCARINGDEVIIALLASLGAETSMESEDSNEELEEEYDNNYYNDIEVRVLESRA